MGTLRMVLEMEKPKNLYAVHGHELRGELLEARRVLGKGRQRQKNWGNCNRINNKI